MKYQIAVLLVALSALASPGAHADIAALNRAISGVYRLHAYGEGNVSFSGSAVAIGPGKFITCCHVTRTAQAISIGRGEKYWRAYWQYKDVERDLCVIAVRDAADDLMLAQPSNDLRVGKKVYAVGYPAGQARLGIQAGEIRALYDHAGGKVIRTNAQFALGQSGGALFDEDGRLLGILSFKAAGRRGPFFAVPADWIEQVEKKAAKSPSPSEAVAFWELGPKRQPRFLDAAALEATGAWIELTSVARMWSETDASSPEAWIALAKALYHTGRKSEALAPLQKAIALSPRHSLGWYQLGLVYRDLGNEQELHKVRGVLQEISPESAARLASGKARDDCAVC